MRLGFDCTSYAALGFQSSLSGEARQLESRSSQAIGEADSRNRAPSRGSVEGADQPVDPTPVRSKAQMPQCRSLSERVVVDETVLGFGTVRRHLFAPLLSRDTASHLGK